MQNVPYDDFEMFMDWTKTKSELKFNSQSKNFPIIPNCIYWAFMGCNIGSEEGKHRPVLVTRTYPNSPTITVLPLTTQRLNDGKQYHVDLEKQNSTVLVEQMRVIDIARIDKPMRKSGSIITITEKDWKAIDYQIKREYILTPLPKVQKISTKNK
jgi:mRNA-degrading endonuclease toxin of MazEF toxin-antitoxin module